MHLDIRLLGPFEVSLEGRPAEFATDRARALLTYLAVEAGRPHRRELLAGLFWSDRPESVARSNLSQTLARLRRAIDDYHAEPPYLSITPKTIEFSSASTTLDVADFRNLTAATTAHAHARLESCETCVRRLEQAVALYRGDLARGLSVDGGSLFEEWLLLTREQLHRQAMEALYSLARYHLKRGDNGRAQSYAQGQLALEPWCEEAHCQLMRALAASGQRSTALAQYQTCRRLLGDELGIEPATETVRLYESIRAGAFTPPVPSPESVTAPVFVGRGQELDRLDAILDEVLAGRGRGALVGGEAGSGKTALACEFSRQATERYVNLVVAVGHCFAPIGIGDPYSPFREILGQLTGDVGAVGPTGIGAGENTVRLLSLAPAAYAALLGRGPDIIGHLIPGPELLARAAALALQDTAPSGWKRQLEERVASSNGDRMQQGNLFQQVAAVLRALASRWPLLLVVEDLHWADTLSLGLFTYLSQQISSSRILLLGTYRPEEAASGAHGSDPLRSVLSELKRAYGETEVDLDLGAGRGAKQAVAAQCPECEFIDALLDVQPNRLDESFRQALVALTAGHPLFATELLREMRERGELRLDRDGYWVADPNLQWSHLPARLQGVIEQRLERLSPGLLAALRVGSVEGVEFTAEMVARVQGLSDQRLIRRLSVEAVRRHRLLAAPRLQWAGSQPLSRYRFRIPLVREYLYQTLDEAERLYLHGAVRRALAQLYGDQSDQIAAQLARRTQTD